MQIEYLRVFFYCGNTIGKEFLCYLDNNINCLTIGERDSVSDSFGEDAKISVLKVQGDVFYIFLAWDREL